MTRRNKGSLEETIQNHTEGTIIMMEVPAENYFDYNTDSIKLLTSKGYGGVYVSFQRPFSNIENILENRGVHTKNLFFIDVAAAFNGERRSQNPQCVHVSDRIEIDELVRAIYTTLPKLSGKKFVFIDSLTTMTLYKPLSETMKFSEFLIKAMRSHDREDVLLIFNVSKDLIDKSFIKDIVMNVDEVIGVS